MTSQSPTPIERPEVLSGRTHKASTPCGNCYVVVNRLGEGVGGNIVEVFCSIGKSGACSSAFLEGLGRLTSLALRAGIEPFQITKTLSNISCSQTIWGNPHLSSQPTRSCLDIVAKVLELESGVDVGPPQERKSSGGDSDTGKD